MTKFILRRLLQSIPTMIGITVLSFAIMAAAPGGPTAALNFSPKSTPQQREQMRENLGVDDPVYKQYLTWVFGDGENREGIIRGDFGNSFTSRRPVTDVLWEKIPATVELGVISLLVGTLLGIPMGILAAVWQGSMFDNFTRILAVFFNAVPVFWLGLMLILIFGAELDLLPMGNRCPITMTGECTIQDRATHMILPVAVLSTFYIAGFSRYMRAATLEVLSQDYIRTARAKGMKDRQVWFTHAARNALVPIVTLLGPIIPGILGGSLITETIFSWPGIGRAAFQAVQQQDYPVVMGVVLLTGVTTIIGYLLSDMLYAVIDPRIRLT